MKMTILKLAVFAACAVPIAANAALVYTPPQAMVLTCNGAAPSITNKTSALATFACANGQIPQAVGVTSGMSSLLGLASGASVLAASEAVPQLALPGVAPQQGVGGGSGSGNSSSNGAGGGNGSAGGNSSGAGNGTSGSGATGSNASNGATGSSTGGGSGSNASNSSGSGNAGSGSGNGPGNGGQAAGGGIGSFFGHLAHAVGAVAQQIGQGVLTGGAVNIPLFNGNGNNGNSGNGYGGNSPAGGNTGGAPMNMQPLQGATPLQVQQQQVPSTLVQASANGNLPSYIHITHVSGLYNWIAANHTDLNGLNFVLHPASVTPVIVPLTSNGTRAYLDGKMAGYMTVFVDEGGHRSTVYPARVLFSALVHTGSDQTGVNEAANSIYQSTEATLSGGPAHWNPPGNRNGPFWPSESGGGSGMHVVPSAALNSSLRTVSSGVCTKIKAYFHAQMGTNCWVDQFPTGTPTHMFPAYHGQLASTPPPAGTVGPNG